MQAREHAVGVYHEEDEDLPSYEEMLVKVPYLAATELEIEADKVTRDTLKREIDQLSRRRDCIADSFFAMRDDWACGDPTCRGYVEDDDRYIESQKKLDAKTQQLLELNAKLSGRSVGEQRAFEERQEKEQEEALREKKRLDEIEFFGGIKQMKAARRREKEFWRDYYKRQKEKMQHEDARRRSINKVNTKPLLCGACRTAKTDFSHNQKGKGDHRRCKACVAAGRLTELGASRQAAAAGRLAQRPDGGWAWEVEQWPNEPQREWVWSERSNVWVTRPVH